MATSVKFEREKLCYEQNCEHMRSLNQIMWQVPMIAMTLTGGLWYAVATVKGMDSIARIGMLGFSAIANVGLIFMINRVRNVIGFHLTKMEQFYPAGYVNAGADRNRLPFFRNRGVCLTFSVLMGIAASFSVIGAWLIWVGKWAPIPC
jgi:hypothetical protein